MKSKLINVIICLFLGSSTAIFAQGKIDLSGVFFDGLTGEELPTKVIAHVKGKSYEVASTDTSNTFNFQLTTDIEEIEFQAEGYKTVKLPVIFHGEFEKHSKAEISIQTFNKKPRFRTEDLIIFCYPSDYSEDKVYEWHVLDSTDYSIRFKFGATFKIDSTSASIKRTRVLTPQGKIEVKDSLSVLDTRVYKTEVGLNFVDTHTYPPLSEFQKAEDSILVRKPIYFENNNFTISEEGITDLDSLISYANNNLKANISITGLMDSNGDTEANQTSAIYSAKVVGNYLKNNGLKDNRFLLFWDLKNEIPHTGKHIEELRNRQKVEILVIK